MSTQEKRPSTETVRRVLEKDPQVNQLSDATLQAAHKELLSHAIATGRVSVYGAESAVPEARLLTLVTREVERRTRAACSILNRIFSRRECLDWRQHERHVHELEARLAIIATRQLP